MGDYGYDDDEFDSYGDDDFDDFSGDENEDPVQKSGDVSSLLHSPVLFLVFCRF